jgi:DMSO/TMAO reductase YedYZ molybdopterin-dependent catalytic subunit
MVTQGLRSAEKKLNRSRQLIKQVNMSSSIQKNNDLYLKPVDGMARLFGKTLTRWILRAASMKEQDLSAVEGFISPPDTYFRRDRHKHPIIDPNTYRLTIDGVSQTKTFTLVELQALPREERLCVMECSGNGNHWQGTAGLIGQARWSGPSFESLLALCGGAGPAKYFAFRGRDGKIADFGYHYGLSLEELLKARAIVALEMNGQPLPRKNGFPARLVVPNVYSMSHVKWLAHIEGKTEPHRGIHNDYVFVNKERQGDKWVKVQARWIGLKSMIVRCRKEGNGYELSGWAWGGERPINKVQVSTDNGKTWQEATLTTPTTALTGEQAILSQDATAAWNQFSFHWVPSGSGVYRVASRAFDEQGNGQDLVQNPNVEGHYNQTRVKWREVEVP